MTQQTEAQQEPEKFRQFLSDAMTAAGLVSHGKQCKALGERLSEAAARYLTAPPQASQPAQDAVDAEPVAWAFKHSDGRITYHSALDALTAYRDTCVEQWPLYTAPQPAQQPLTDDEIVKIQRSHPAFMTSSCRAFARAVEAAHGIGGGE